LAVTSTTRAGRRKFSVDALFADTSPRAAGVSDLVEAKSIQLSRIQPDPDQPRRTFDDERLEELADSMRSEGVLQPIAVRYEAVDDIYVIVHGERRWRAAQLAGLENIPAVVRDVPPERRLVQQLMENVVREDLNAVDRAAALRGLKAQLGDASWERVAEAVGIKRSRLFQLLATEQLEPTLQEAIRRGLVSEKQTRAVHGLQPEQQADLGARVIAGTLDPRQVEQVAQALKRRRPASTSADFVDLTRKVSDVRHQARRLAASLADLTPEMLEGMERQPATALAAELRTVQVRIDALLESSPCS
jgi:ParB family chromosome partitioning protein